MRIPLLGTRAQFPPGGPFPMNVGRPVSVAALDAAGADGLVVAWQGEGSYGEGAASFWPVGLRVRILQQTAPRGPRTVVIYPLERVRLTNAAEEAGCWYADASSWPVTVEDSLADRFCETAVRRILCDPKIPDAAAEPVRTSFELALSSLFQTLPVEGAMRAELLAQDAETLVNTLLVHAERDIERLSQIEPRPAPPAPEDVPSEDLDELQELAELLARSGSMGAADLMEHLASQFDEDDEVDEAAVGQAVARAIASSSRRLHGIERPTDAERVVAALQGIQGVAVFGNVAPGGWSEEIDEDLDAALAGSDAQGVVYWTTNAGMAAAAGQGLSLGFRANPDTPPAEKTTAVGRQVVEALRAAGLPVWWPDDPSLRIEVPVRWLVPVGAFASLSPPDH